MGTAAEWVSGLPKEAGSAALKRTKQLRDASHSGKVVCSLAHVHAWVPPALCFEQLDPVSFLHGGSVDPERSRTKERPMVADCCEHDELCHRQTCLRLSTMSGWVNKFRGCGSFRNNDLSNNCLLLDDLS